MEKRVMGDKWTRMFRGAFFSLLVAAATTGCAMAGPIAGPFSGDGTFYGPQPTGGHCSLYTVPGWWDLPWRTTGVEMTVAINHPQYANSEACGYCIRYRTLNPDCTTCGARSQYITREWKFALVADECPECGWGSLDLAVTGDGRWRFEWEILQCNVGNSGFRYALVGSNRYYIKLMILNTRYPVKAVEVLSDSGWKQLVRQPDNAFVGTGTTFPMPLKMHITSIFGDVIYDELHLFNYSGWIDGWGQFVDKGYTTVGKATASEA